MIQNFIVLNGRDGTLFTSTLQVKANDYERKFTQDEGFQVAFAVIDADTDDFSDVLGRKLEDYLQVKLVQEHYNDDPKKQREKIVITPHPCTDAELGLDDSGTSKFYSIPDEDRETLLALKPYFQCFDHKDVVLSNDWSSAESESLTVGFDIPKELCLNRT